jgi:2-alkenal reductase
LVASTPVRVENSPPSGATAQNAPAASQELQAGVLELEQRLIDLYALVNPSVVHILVYTSRSDPLPLGSGSGFIFDSNGHIVTNNHVVEDGGEFEVVFSDGSRRRADVIGRDIDSDLAVIEVESLPGSYSPVTLGNSDDLRVGQLVIVLGNPFGEQGSMSLGIVSGLGRSLRSQREPDSVRGRYSLPEVVQTDAPINPGNSGGPLVNLNGEVVGVNSAILTATGVNSGVGFSIPVNAIRRIVPVLIEDGSYVYAYMGVQIQSLNLNLQERFELTQPTGAYVTSITGSGPAEDAGLIPASDFDGTGGDLIIAIDGSPVRDTEELIAYLVFHAIVGQTVDLTVIRDGDTIIVPLTLGERP